MEILLTKTVSLKHGLVKGAIRSLSRRAITAYEGQFGKLEEWGVVNTVNAETLKASSAARIDRSNRATAPKKADKKKEAVNA